MRPIEQISGNLAVKGFWPEVAQHIGEDYADTAKDNFHEQGRMRASWLGRAQFRHFTGERRGELITPAESVWKWYRLLGSQNSLHGGYADLTRAAAVVALDLTHEEAAEDHTVDFIVKANHDKEFPLQRPEAAVQSVQLLVDAARDPKPGDPAERIGILETAARLSGRVKAGLLEKAGELTRDEKRILSSAIKFEGEAKIVRIGMLPDSHWEDKLVAYHERTLKDATLSDAERAVRAHKTIEDLREDTLLAECREQVRELQNLPKPLSLGDLAEHYFVHLLRYTVLSKNGKAFAYAATDRQDAPIDRLKGRGLPRLAFDAMVTYYEPNRTQYVQLKARAQVGSAKQEGYQEDMVVINPFKDLDFKPENRNLRLREDPENDRAISHNNKLMFEDIHEGLKQMGGAMNELLDGVYYNGPVDVLERHKAAVDDALKQHIQG